MMVPQTTSMLPFVIPLTDTTTLPFLNHSMLQTVNPSATEHDALDDYCFVSNEALMQAHLLQQRQQQQQHGVQAAFQSESLFSSLQQQDHQNKLKSGQTQRTTLSQRKTAENHSSTPPDKTSYTDNSMNAPSSNSSSNICTANTTLKVARKENSDWPLRLNNRNDDGENSWCSKENCSKTSERKTKFRDRSHSPANTNVGFRKADGQISSPNAAYSSDAIGSKTYLKSRSAMSASSDDSFAVGEPVADSVRSSNLMGKHSLPISLASTPLPSLTSTSMPSVAPAFRETVSQENLAFSTDDAYAESGKRLGLVHSALVSSYHSEESVFDSQLTKRFQDPSYVRISCTLTGYRNSRSPHLASVTHPQLRAARLTHTTPLITKSLGSPYALQTFVPPAKMSHGKSIVEQRTEQLQSKLKNVGDGVFSANDKMPRNRCTPCAVVPSDVPTSTSVKDIIRDYNSFVTSLTAVVPSRAKQSPFCDATIQPSNNGKTTGRKDPRKNGQVNKLAKEIDALSCKTTQSPREAVPEVATSNDGAYYLTLLEEARAALLKQQDSFESDFNRLDSLPEDVAGEIRLAFGKANLLMDKKFAKFTELCQLNMTQSPDDEFKALNEDLDGYWHLVKIELRELLSQFERLERLRFNNWQLCGKSEKNSSPLRLPKPRRAGATTSSSVILCSGEKDTARKQRIRDMKLAKKLEMQAALPVE